MRWYVVVKWSLVSKGLRGRPVSPCTAAPRLRAQPGSAIGNGLPSCYRPFTHLSILPVFALAPDKQFIEL